jgi:ribose 1,5-bisphosphate isomerase
MKPKGQAVGAEEIARSSILVLKEVIANHRKDDLLEILLLHQRNFLKVRPTQPLLKNSMRYLFFNVKPEEKNLLKSHLQLKIETILNHYGQSQQAIAKAAADKIKKGSIIFTHAYSSTIINALTEAKNQGKDFTVYNTETRPSYEGRLTSQRLAKEGIKVVHFVDAAARLALKKSDVYMIGADTITKDAKIANKVGSEMFAEIADRLHIPIYACADSWKYDVAGDFNFEDDLARRPKEEIWPAAPVKINNFAFELVNPELVTSIITEIGGFKPAILVEEVKRKYPWFFNL